MGSTGKGEEHREQPVVVVICNWNNKYKWVLHDGIYYADEDYIDELTKTLRGS